MILVPKWKAILTKAWSVRLMAVAALLSGAEAALAFLTPELLGVPPGVFAALAGGASMGALIARVMAQSGVTDAAE
jgi:hypothetical protein